MCLISVIYMCLLFLNCVYADRPCAARHIQAGRSVVCVCNATYCDDVVRDPPPAGGYVLYTSSKGGFRFHKKVGQFQERGSKSGTSTNIKLDPTIKYQVVEGFGGAVTDSAAINWKSLSAQLQNTIIDAYFGQNGIGYSIVRVPIGGCDFSTREYAYNELPLDDINLSNYTLAPEDVQFKIPMIQKIKQVSKTPLHVVATTWSPPLWMKTPPKNRVRNRLKPDYFQAYADYHYKFIEKYEEYNISTWAITATNEPANGIMGLADFNCIGWTVDDMGKWIVNNLGPTIRNSKYKNVKILTGDDQRYAVPFYFNLLINEHPKAIEYIDGVAVHFYGDRFTPASVLITSLASHPDKFILATEACEGTYPWQRESVELGSWGRAESYISDIIEDMNYNVIGWLDWNMCLDETGGPNWAGNFADSPIIISSSKQEFIKQPMFYAMGHVSKFVPRGSIRILAKEKKPFFQFALKHVAFLTPNKTIVLIIFNRRGESVTLTIRCLQQQATIKLEPNSISTMEFSYIT